MDVNGKKVKLSIWVCREYLSSVLHADSLIHRTLLARNDLGRSLRRTTVAHRGLFSYTMWPTESPLTDYRNGSLSWRHTSLLQS
jgi:hypothetical protein